LLIRHLFRNKISSFDAFTIALTRGNIQPHMGKNMILQFPESKCVSKAKSFLCFFVSLLGCQFK